MNLLTRELHHTDCFKMAGSNHVARSKPFPTLMSMTATFSYTAPQFSEDDLRDERAALSSAERFRVDGDRNGTFAILRETPEMIANAESAFAEALARIDDTKKAAYLEAVERCPAVVGTETDALRFLRCDDFDPEVSMPVPLRY